jgi:plastocyanin
MALCVSFAVAALAPLACSDNNDNNLTGVGGHIGGIGGGGGSVLGTGGAGGANPDAGGDGSTVANAAQITISNFTFSPQNLTVPAGSTITVMNMDTADHTATSSSAITSFVNGAVSGIAFDTGTIPPGGSATITIPANAPHGTVIPYFCKIHLKGMKNTPTITVQ